MSPPKSKKKTAKRKRKASVKRTMRKIFPKEVMDYVDSEIRESDVAKEHRDEE